MWEIVGSIVLEGFKYLNEDKKLELEREFHDVLKAIRKAENDHSGNYTDSAVDLAYQRKVDFLKAYRKALAESKNEK